MHVAAFCRTHANKVDGAFLDAVAGENEMAAIDGRAALSLLKQALSHSGPDLDKDKKSLRKRCIEVLARS